MDYVKLSCWGDKSALLCGEGRDTGEVTAASATFSKVIKSPQGDSE